MGLAEMASRQADAIAALEAESGMLREELRQCQTELEEAANLLRPHLPGMASVYDAAAKRVAVVSKLAQSRTPL